MAGKRENQEALLKKVDALLKRHRSGAAVVAHELIDVPVLTDMVDDDESAATPKRNKTRATRTTRPADQALKGLAADIFERVFEKLDDRFSAQFEKRLASQIERAIHATLLKVGSDLKQDLMNSISDAIAEALAEKLNDKTTPTQKTP